MLFKINFYELVLSYAEVNVCKVVYVRQFYICHKWTCCIILSEFTIQKKSTIMNLYQFY